MSSTTSKQTAPQPPRDVNRGDVTELRIDPPHSASQARVEESLEDTQDVDLAAADLQQLPDMPRRQINQLAQLLRQRQMELDRREAELNARLADFETQQRSAAIALAEQMDYGPRPVYPAGSPSPTAPPATEQASSTNPLKAVDQQIRLWRRKWRRQAAPVADLPPSIDLGLDGVAVRLEKLSEAETQLAQQWALLKNARALQAVREKEFAGYAQKIERELEQSRAQHHQWLEQEQQQLTRQQDDVATREEELAAIQTELEQSFSELLAVRETLETAWDEVRARIPSALRRRLDQQVRTPIEQTDRALGSRHQAAKREIHQLLHQLEQAKLEIQEEQVRLEDELQRHQGELRRARHELRDRETLVRAQLAELRREHETLNETKRELLEERYHDLTRQLVPRAA